MSFSSSGYIYIWFFRYFLLHSPGSKSMDAASCLWPSVFRISLINLFQLEPVVCTNAWQYGWTPSIKLATEILCEGKRMEWGCVKHPVRLLGLGGGGLTVAA
jgi:hypothetical protein